jgi:hypothetical protein
VQIILSASVPSRSPLKTISSVSFISCLVMLFNLAFWKSDLARSMPFTDYIENSEFSTLNLNLVNYGLPSCRRTAHISVTRKTIINKLCGANIPHSIKYSCIRYNRQIKPAVTTIPDLF